MRVTKVDLNKEKELVEQAQKDQQYFGELFDAYYTPIFNYALKRTGDAATAQDVTAETFFKAMTNLPKFKWQGTSIGNWFYKIATNEIRLYYRKGKYQPTSLDVLFAGGFEATDEHDFVQELVDAQDTLDRQVEFQQAQTALAELPLKYREVILLRFMEKKKLAEIAVILDKKEGTVKSLLSRGLGRLKKQLEQMEMQPNKPADIIASEGHVLITSQEAYEE